MMALPSHLLAGPTPDLSRIGHQARSLRWFAAEARGLIEARPCPACSARLLLLDDTDETAAIDGALIDRLLAADLNLSIAAMTDGITRAAAGVAVTAPHVAGCPRHRPAGEEAACAGCGRAYRRRRSRHRYCSDRCWRRAYAGRRRPLGEGA